MDRRNTSCLTVSFCSRNCGIQKINGYCRLILAASVLLLTSCSTHIIGSIHKEPFVSPDAIFYRDLSLYKTSLPYYCGPESLKAIMDHFGYRTKIEVITDAIYEPENKGTRPKSVVDYAMEKGLLVEAKNGSLEELNKSLNDGKIPLIIVQIKPELRHFLVIIGFDSYTKNVIAADYDNQYRVIPFEELQGYWRMAENLQINIYKKSELAAIMDEAESLKEQGKYEQALAQYLNAKDIDGNDYEIHKNIGDCYYITGDKAGAVESYQKAYSLNQNDPVLNNNLASALLDTEKEIKTGYILVDDAVKQFESLYNNETDTTENKRYLFRWITSLTTLAEYREYNKNYELALAAYTKAYNLIPEQYTDMRENKIKSIASCYKKLGKIKTAREWESKIAE